ncbi:hypothetical protein BB987_09205 [Photorhabdus temperata]|uniref:Uncharacterized protein n=1 Tax=Photorhabdus khanii NC19 TaxID=1004151 RepID=W3V5M6_9GAMM|nr:hypothetical protein [Photorhabdus khanii]ETS31078.1 hypothetical protein PTE_03029 [Photorhabdus khanii NC19]OHV54885.1 hypothetical protein BB987_09205 [Photorhabdus temperata]
MSVLFGYSEIKTMITYEDLQKTAEEANEKRFTHAEILRGCISHFIEQYEQSLAIVDRTFRDHKGQQEKIVTLGINENGIFKEKHLHELKLSDDFSLSFVIKTVITTKDPQSTWIASPITISRQSGVVTFVFTGSSETASCRIPQGNLLTVYSEAAETLKLMTMDLIKQTAPE